jgi:hypothetical protein
MPSRRLEIKVTGTLYGFANTHTEDEEARAKLVLEAEQRVNRFGDMRLHLNLADKQPDNETAPALPWDEVKEDKNV